MEEEYRAQKAAAAGDGQLPSVSVSQPKDGADDDASVRGVAPTDKKHGDSLDAGGGIPTIRISTDSDHEREQAERRAAAASPTLSDTEETDESTLAGTTEIAEGSKRAAVPMIVVEANGVDRSGLERPVQAAAPPPQLESQQQGGQQQDAEPGTPAQGPHADPFSFSNKRLCERWLDNLFMVLYEVSGFFLRHLLKLLPLSLPFTPPTSLADTTPLFCLWVNRTFVYGRSSVPRLRTSRRSTSLTERQRSSGRF
jgi:Chs5-Arf1p-binding protein BUD7/BCH1